LGTIESGVDFENVQGGEKVGHWSGGMMLLRAV